MLRIAILADIHANKYALSAFLQYLESNFPADQIWNVGDFIQIGPNPKEVAEIVLSDPRFRNILGNNETQVITYWESQIGDKIDRAQERAHTAWNVQQLGEGLLKKMKLIPEELTFSIENKQILLIHSRMNKSSDLPVIFNDQSMEKFIMDYPKQYDCVVFGHIHEQQFFNWQSRMFINPGSLGCSKDGTMAFCLVTIEDGHWNLDFKRIPYDTSMLLHDYSCLNVPDAEYILKRFYGCDAL